jgi:hypothetical protein
MQSSFARKWNYLFMVAKSAQEKILIAAPPATRPDFSSGANPLPFLVKTNFRPGRLQNSCGLAPALLIIAHTGSARAYGANGLEEPFLTLTT